MKTINESTDVEPILFLVGTQKDLERLYLISFRVVSEEEAQSLKSKIGITFYMECSAKDNDGVQEVTLPLTIRSSPQ